MKPGLYFCQPWRSPEGWRIALSPMFCDTLYNIRTPMYSWSLIRKNSSDVYCICDSSILDSYCSIIINICYKVWIQERDLILIFCASFKQHFVSNFILVRNSCPIFLDIIFIYNFLFPCSNEFPICFVGNIEHHVSAKHQLCWTTLSSGVDC